jgi:hypothetical protein
MKKLVKVLFSSVLIVLIGLFFQTCKKDKPSCSECNTDECINFLNQDSTIGFITQAPNQRHAPCFNPNNISEFTYIKEENDVFTLVKYNIDTKVENVLIENARIVGRPKWGRNGWIVFDKRTDLQIYILKENGDSVRQVTNYFQNLDPIFLGDNKIFFTVSMRVDLDPSGGIKVIDLFGNRLDSIKPKDLEVAQLFYSDANTNQVIASWVWSPQNNICSIKKFDFSTRQYQPVYDFVYNGRNIITGICWHPNNEDIYFSTAREGIFKVNINSKKVVKLRNGCDKRMYFYLSISPDGKKIIVERVDATEYQKKQGDYTSESKIFIMDIDGKNERNVFE